MIRLQVPYAQKDAAKSMGARWDQAGKTWYVPPGALASSFERWMPAVDMPRKIDPKKPVKKSRPRVDSYVGKTITGAHYFDAGHDCNPFEECAACRPALESSGWLAAHHAALELIQRRAEHSL